MVNQLRSGEVGLELRLSGSSWLALCRDANLPRAEGQDSWYCRTEEAFRSSSAHAAQAKYKLEAICILK